MAVSPMNLLDRIDRTIARVEGWLMVGMLWLMVLVTFVQVVLRGLYAYGHVGWANTLLGTIDGSGPFVSLLVLWLTFLGASLLTRDGRHIQIDLLSGVLPERWHRARDMLLASASLLISAMMLKVCIDYVLMEMAFGGTTVFHLPVWVAQVILPAGFALLCFRFLLRALHEGIRLLRGVP